MKRSVYVIIGIWMILISGYAISDSLRTQSKVVYVDMARVFESFNMKKELEIDFQKKSSVQKRLLDSLQLKYEQLEFNYSRGKSILTADSLMVLGQQLKVEGEKWTSQIAPLKGQYDDQIQQRLFQYLQKYGEENDFDLLLTTLDASTVIYGKEMYDVTGKAIEYVNQRYAGN